MGPSARGARGNRPLLPGRPPHLQDVHGVARLALTRGAGRERLAELYQRDPLRLLFPDPAPGDPLTAALLTTSGGLVGGDRLEISVSAGAGSSLLVVAQAAEKVYRSLGPAAQVTIDLAAGNDTWLEWLPQETIVFDGARLRRETRLQLTASAEGIAGDILVLGRVHSGERCRRGSLREAWRVSVDGRLAWADALQLDLDSGLDASAAVAFAGASACATLLHWSPQAPVRLALAREALAGFAGHAGATLIHGLLLVRWLGADALALRRSFQSVWRGLRAAAGRPPRLPRLWHA